MKASSKTVLMVNEGVVVNEQSLEFKGSTVAQTVRCTKKDRLFVLAKQQSNKLRLSRLQQVVVAHAASDIHHIIAHHHQDFLLYSFSMTKTQHTMSIPLSQTIF